MRSLGAVLWIGLGFAPAILFGGIVLLGALSGLLHLIGGK